MKHVIYSVLMLSGLIQNPYAKASESMTFAHIQNAAIQKAKRGDIRGAIYFLTHEVERLESLFSPNSIVAEVNTQFTDHRKEIVTRTEERQKGVSIFGSSLFDLISANGKLWRNSRVDITKIITLNPREVAQYPLAVQNDFEVLRNKIHNHISLHLNEILTAKYLTIEAYRLIAAGNTVNWTSTISSEDLSTIDEISQVYSFGGQQNITACISTDYTNHSEHHDEGESLAANLFSLKIGYLNRRESKTTYYAHNETECTFSSRNLWEKSAPYLVINLAQLDQRISEWKTQAQMRLKFSNEPHLGTQDEPYQAWGLE